MWPPQQTWLLEKVSTSRSQAECACIEDLLTLKPIVTAVKLADDRLMVSTSKEPYCSTHRLLGLLDGVERLAFYRQPSGHQPGCAHNLPTAVSKDVLKLRPRPNDMRTYWAFYWPLALTAIGMVLSIQFQNATLARYPEAVTELAILALSLGVFSFFNASQQFIAQLSNVYARSPRRQSPRLAVCGCCEFSHHRPTAVIGSRPDRGAELIELIFSIEPDVVDRVREYLLLLCPLIF